MISDLRYAQLALMAYDAPTHKVGNASMYMAVGAGCLNIAIAGTNDKLDIANDIMMIPWKPEELRGRWVHLGFWRYFMQLWPLMVRKMLLEGLPVRFIGHSLGGTAALYGTAMLVLEQYMPVDSINTFGTPRCMSPAMSKLIAHVEGKRFRHDGDPVPYGGLFGYDRRDETLLCGNTDGPDHPLQNYIDALS